MFGNFPKYEEEPMKPKSLAQFGPKYPGEDFSNENYRIAEEYLESEGYVGDTFMGLTSYGRTYFENWIRNFEDLNLEEREQLQKELSPKMYDFFGLAEKAKTILDVISKLIEINDKV